MGAAMVAVVLAGGGGPEPRTSAENWDYKACNTMENCVAVRVSRDGPPPAPTPTPTPQPTPTPPSFTGFPPVDRWFALVSAYDWNVFDALMVMYCESRGDPTAVSLAGCVGLFQICGTGHSYDQLIDPATNISIAYHDKYLDGVRRGNPWWHWNQFGACG